MMPVLTLLSKIHKAKSSLIVGTLILEKKCCLLPAWLGTEAVNLGVP